MAKAKYMHYYMSVGSLLMGVKETKPASSGGRDVTLLKSIVLLSQNMSPTVTKEDYLHWVRAWKKLYLQVSDLIIDFKDYRDGRGDIGDNMWEATRSYRQSDVHDLKKIATHLLQLRATNKILAKMAYEYHNPDRNQKKGEAGATAPYLSDYQF